MSDEKPRKPADDLVDAVSCSDTVARVLKSTSEEERASVEATVKEAAALFAPLLEAMRSLESSEEAIALAKAKLSGRGGGG